MSAEISLNITQMKGKEVTGSIKTMTARTCDPFLIGTSAAPGCGGILIQLPNDASYRMFGPSSGI